MTMEVLFNRRWMEAPLFLKTRPALCDFEVVAPRTEFTQEMKLLNA